jgi:hypothetical protein
MKIQTKYKQVDPLFAIKVYSWIVTVELLLIIIMLLAFI